MVVLCGYYMLVLLYIYLCFMHGFCHMLFQSILYMHACALSWQMPLSPIHAPNCNYHLRIISDMLCCMCANGSEISVAVLLLL